MHSKFKDLVFFHKYPKCLGVSPDAKSIWVSSFISEPSLNGSSGSLQVISNGHLILALLNVGSIRAWAWSGRYNSKMTTQLRVRSSFSTTHYPCDHRHSHQLCCTSFFVPIKWELILNNKKKKKNKGITPMCLNQLLTDLEGNFQVP